MRRDTLVANPDADEGTEIRTPRGHTNAIRSMGFSPDGQRIVSGSDDNTMRLWRASPS
jgi:WD40 repeat protein